MVGSLIGYPAPEPKLEEINSEAIVEMIRYLSSFCDFVCYTDNHASAQAVNWARRESWSVVQILHSVPDIRLVYQCAWQHLEKARVDENDWVVVLNSYELLYGAEDLQRHCDAFPYEVLGITNDDGILEPRIFKFYHGGCNFYPGNIWPSYVDNLISRPYRYCEDNGMQLMDFREEKDFLDFL